MGSWRPRDAHKRTASISEPNTTYFNWFIETCCFGWTIFGNKTVISNSFIFIPLIMLYFNWPICSWLEIEFDPWWKVDLGSEHCISKVTIYNRPDCCSKYYSKNRLSTVIHYTCPFINSTMRSLKSLSYSIIILWQPTFCILSFIKNPHTEFYFNIRWSLDECCSKSWDWWKYI